MTSTEDALYIVTGVLMLFGGPFFLGFTEAITTDNWPLMWQIIPVGFAIIFFSFAVMFLGVWVDR